MANVTQRFQKDGTYGPPREHLIRSYDEWLIPLKAMLAHPGIEESSDEFVERIGPYREFQPHRGLILNKFTSEALMEEVGIDLRVRFAVRGIESHVLVDEYLCNRLLKITDYASARKRGEIVGIEGFHEAWAIAPLSTVVEAAKYVDLGAL